MRETLLMCPRWDKGDMLFSELIWHSSAQGPAPTPPSRWRPSTPVTQSSANLLDLHKMSSMADAAPEVHPTASSGGSPQLPTCAVPCLYSLRALWPYQGEEPGAPWLCPPSSLGNDFGCSPLTGHWWDVALSTLNFCTIGSPNSDWRYSFPDLAAIVLHLPVSLKPFLGAYSWVHIPQEAAISMKRVTVSTKRIHPVCQSHLASLPLHPSRLMSGWLMNKKGLFSKLNSKMTLNRRLWINRRQSTYL